jgi:PAS domain S-box-containing protein
MTDQPPELQLLYETAPVGLAFLSPECRYLQINQHLTEICGISVADHIGRSVRDTVPQVADQVEHIVQTILRTGEAVTAIEVSGQRPDGGNAARVWLTYWHPLKDTTGKILGINVVAEEITERKRAEAALAESEARFRELADNMSQFAWTADALGSIYWYNKRWHDYTGTTLEEMHGWDWQEVHNRTTSSASSIVFGKASKLAPHGRTPFHFGAGTALIVGSCPVHCQSATRRVTSSDGSAPTLT